MSLARGHTTNQLRAMEARCWRECKERTLLISQAGHQQTDQQATRPGKYTSNVLSLCLQWKSEGQPQMSSYLRHSPPSNQGPWGRRPPSAELISDIWRRGGAAAAPCAGSFAQALRSYRCDLRGAACGLGASDAFANGLAIHPWIQYMRVKCCAFALFDISGSSPRLT